MQPSELPKHLQHPLCRNALEPLVIEEAYQQLSQVSPDNLPSSEQEMLFFQVIAYALNRLPALYATSQTGWEMQQKLARETLQDQIKAVVRTGIATVRKNPPRESWQEDHHSLPRPHQAVAASTLMVNFSQSPLADLSQLELDKLLTQHPDHSEAWMQKGWRMFEQKLYESALESFDVAAALSPNNPEVWAMRASILQKLGRYEQAIASYHQANGLTVMHS